MKIIIQSFDEAGNEIITKEFEAQNEPCKFINTKDGKKYWYPNEYMQEFMTFLAESESLLCKCDKCNCELCYDEIRDVNDHFFLCPNCENDE